MRRFFWFALPMIQCVLGVAICSRATADDSKDFNVLVVREKTEDGLIKGTISVNGEVIGNTYENAELKIPPGTYKGILRYWSGHNFVGGPFGTLGKEGDFLLEVANVKEADGTKRTNILFHGGDKPHQSKGCIMLGPVPKGPDTGKPYLPEDHPLRRLRRLFYGTDTPNSTPNRDINIEIRGEP
jgi:hypothetical protein